MKFSSRSHYGLRAMIAIARGYTHGPVSLSEIARSEDISLSYLEQLMSRLKKAGLVAGSRGAHGGYQLNEDPSLVTVGAVLRALEGPIAPAECASESDQASCSRAVDCPSRIVWERVRDNVASVLDATTLADLCCDNIEQCPSKYPE